MSADPEIPEGEGNTDTSPPKKKACVHWGYTLNNPTEEERLKLIQDSKELCKKWRFQLEVGECGTPHYQGYMGLKKKLTFAAIKKLCPRAHWFAAANQRDPSALQAYVSKLETATGEWWGNIRSCTVPRPTNEWQVKILEEIEKPADLRTITWVCDRVGGKGKSWLAKYMALYCGALVVCGKASDMKFAIHKMIETGKGAPEVVILDLPRSVDLEYLSYTGVEEIKNGCFFSPKYEGGMCVFNNPHVYVFSNEMPARGKLSGDRWRIIDLDEAPETDILDWILGLV